MIFQILSSIILLFMITYQLVFVTNTFLKLGLLGLYVSLIYFTWYPHTTTVIANFFGIGRGIDLFLLVFSIIVINVAFIIIKRLTKINRQLTKLTRELAIINSFNPKKNRSKA
jgi:hypothetical protein